MPFVSLKQEGFLHEHPEILGQAGLKEWDSATKGMSLPERATHALKTIRTLHNRGKSDG